MHMISDNLRFIATRIHDIFHIPNLASVSKSCVKDKAIHRARARPSFLCVSFECKLK